MFFKKGTKLEFYKNEKNTNQALIKIQNEDHTIGNLIQKQLSREFAVIFSGYKKFHPLEYSIVLKIITNGKVTPIEAFDSSLKNLYVQFSLIEEKLC